MIAVDTSALVAVVLGEPEAELYLEALQTQPALLSTVSMVEAALVVESRQGLDATRDLQLHIEHTIDTLVELDVELAWGAVGCGRRFGRGRHPAGLNFGDCLAYALAKNGDVPLLYKGRDFAQTDITAAL